MRLLDLLTPSGEKEPFSRSRVVPAQPSEVPRGTVYMGRDLGFVPFAGERPRPGDMATVVGQGGSRVVTTAGAVPSMRAPTFAGGCVCRCPSAAGIAFYLTFVRQVANIIALDAETGAVRQLFGMNELGFGVPNTNFPQGGIAVDPQAPYRLYVLDDRRLLSTLKTDAAPDVRRGYFALVTFELVGGRYMATATVDLTDPYVPPSGGSLQPTEEPDPPAVPTNCLSVIGGVPHITMQKAPARYLTVTGSTVTTHNLTRGGVNYERGLRGPVVSVPDAPAKPGDRFVIASDEGGHELLQFGTNGAIRRVLNLGAKDVTDPVGLVTYCNRLLLLNTEIATS